MAKTFLEMGQDVAVETRLDKPTQLFGNEEEDAVLIRTCLQKSALLDVMRAENWAILRKRYSFQYTTDDDEYDLPTHFDRIINGTVWDIGYARPMAGPINSQEWEWIQYGIGATAAVTTAFTIMRATGTDETKKVFLVYPTPTSDDSSASVAYQYITSQYVYDSVNSLFTEFTGDDQFTMLDDEIVILGAAVRVLEDMGMDYAEKQDRFNALRKDRIAKDGGAPNINMANVGIDPLDYNLPETGYG